MKDLTTQTGIIVKCSKTAIEFFQNAQSVDFFSALEIPKEFQDIAVEFYDLIMENDHLAALLGCRGNYDIWDKVTGFTASKEALAFLLRQLTDIKNEVPDEDGIREIVDLWKNEDSGEIAPAWSEHLDWLIKRLISEQEA